MKGVLSLTLLVPAGDRVPMKGVFVCVKSSVGEKVGNNVVVGFNVIVGVNVGNDVVGGNVSLKDSVGDPVEGGGVSGDWVG